MAQTSMSPLPTFKHRSDESHLAQTLTLQWDVSGAQQVLTAHRKAEGKATCSVHLHIIVKQALWDSQNFTLDIEHLSWLRQRLWDIYIAVKSEIILNINNMLSATGICNWSPSLKDLWSDWVLLKFFGVFALIAMGFYGGHQQNHPRCFKTAFVLFMY